MVEGLNILADPVRRRILEILAIKEQPAGKIVKVIREEFGISQPAVSQHLKTLRNSQLATVTVDAQRRIYAIDPRPLLVIDNWLAQFRRFWEGKLDDLAKEVERSN